MSDLDYKCSLTPNMSVISKCKDAVHHVDAPFQFTHQILILVQKSFQLVVIIDMG